MTAPTREPDREYAWLAIDAELPDGWHEGNNGSFLCLHHRFSRLIWREASDD